MMVVDASAIIELLLDYPAAAEVDDQLRPNRRWLCAPHLIDVEVTSALRRLTLTGKIEAADAEAALVDFGAFHLIRYPHGSCLPRAFELRDNVSSYDAMYVCLAEALDAPLLTADAALARIPDCEAEVIVVGAGR